MAARPRTSETDPIQVAWLPLTQPGRVGLTLAPGKQAPSAYSGRPWRRDLAADLDRLARVYAVTTLVCLMEDHELHACGIAGLETAAGARGITFLRLPIPDGGIPADRDAVRTLVAEVAGRAQAGSHTAIHCRGGLGRTGTIAGVLLRTLGFGVDEALAALHDARGPACPETAAQIAYITRYPVDTGEPPRG